MSANRDKKQRFGFLYSNLYQIYQAEKMKNEQSTKIPSSFLKEHFKKGIIAGETLKTGIKIYPETKITQEVPEVKAYNPPVFSNEKPVTKHLTSQNWAVDNLKKNLNDLSSLHQRLKFMLTELEDLVKKEDK